MINLSNTQAGRLAELKIEAFLKEKNCRIVLKNFRVGRSEIDLIFQEGIYLVFGEVKFRSNSNYGSAQSSLSEAQESRIMEAANSYLEENTWKGRIRFDLFCLSGEIENPQIEHIKDAF